MSPEEVQRRLAQLELLCLDVDGVLTDGRITYTGDNVELKSFDARDGHGIKMVLAAGVSVAIISGRSSPAVVRRGEELGIRWILQGVADKRSALSEILNATGATSDRSAHVGDDSPDLVLVGKVGLFVAVADAHPEVLAKADLTTGASGGRGAVRELCDRIVQAKRMTS